MIASAIPRDLRDYFNRYFWTRKIGRSDKTKKQYNNTIGRFDAWLGRAATLDDLHDDTICAYLQERRAISQYAAAKCRINLKAIADHAAKKGHIDEWVDLPTIAIAWPDPIAVRPEQFRALLDACHRWTGEIDGVPAFAWWRAILLVFLTTGERTEAVLSIGFDALVDNGSDCWLRVPANIRKGRKKSMTYPVPRFVYEEAAALARPGRTKIFGRGFCLGTFYNRYAKMLEWAGLPTTRRWKPQALRRSFASYAKKLGFSIQDVLDHSSPATGRTHYDDVTITGSPPVGEMVAGLFGLESQADAQMRLF